MLTAAEVRNYIGQPESSRLYRSGEYDPNSAGIHPLKLTRGLANVVEEKYDVTIHEHTKATSIERLSTTNDNKHLYKITTNSGAEITCHHVVLCTGPEHVSKALSQQLSRAILPVYTWMASTEPLNDKCPLPPNNASSVTLCGDDYVCLNYWRSHDSRILFGSLADAFPVPEWLAKYRLQRALAGVYPQLADVRLDHVWGGAIAVSRYAVPLIGRDTSFDHNNTTESDGGVWYATGFAGHGIVPTCMAGTILADAILGQSQDWKVFQQHFQPESIMYPVVSRLGAQIVFGIYNAWDWMHVKGIPVPKLRKPW